MPTIVHAADTNQPTIIIPNVSVGPVKTHMTDAKLLATLGTPDKKSGKTASIWEYTRYGFAVFTSPKGVALVMCGDSSGLGTPLSQAFTARTREGIGLGSTRDEIIRALGQPTLARPGNAEGQEELIYQSLGLTFHLDNTHKAFHLIVDFRQSP
jgi:hypothetical protein